MTRRWLVTVTFTALLAASSVAAAQAHERGHGHHKRHADTVLVGGKVLLYGKHDRWASAVAVDDGRIAYVGEDRKARKLIGPRTEVVDLDGKLLMPGMVDGHAHGSSFVACDMGYTGGTIEEVLGKLKACLLRPDQAAFLKSNLRLTASNIYIQSLLPPGTRLTRDVLDRLSASPAEDEFGTGTTRPIVVRDSGGHEFSTNSQAIVNAGITASTPDPAGRLHRARRERRAERPVRRLQRELGTDTARPPDATYLARVQNVAEASRKGITSYMRPNGSVADLAHWKRMADEGLLTVRINQAIGAGSCAARTTRSRSAPSSRASTPPAAPTTGTRARTARAISRSTR